VWCGRLRARVRRWQVLVLVGLMVVLLPVVLVLVL
jgi:hypothetical protein